MRSITKQKSRVAILVIKNITLAGLLILFIFSAGHFYNKSITVREVGFIDTPTFITQAGFFIESGKLYSNPLKEGGELDGFEPASPWYKFPPAYLLAYMPWAPPLVVDANFNYEEYGQVINQLAREIWAVHVIRYLLALSIILALLNSTKSYIFMLNGMVMGLLFSPFFESLYGLIFDNVLLFLLALILLLNKYGKNTFSGGIVGAAAMFKLYPAVLVLWALAIRNGKFFLYFFIVSGFLLIASLLVFGIDNNIFFYTRLLPLLLDESSMAEDGNFSLGYFFVRFWQEKEIAMFWFSLFKTFMLAATTGILWLYGRHRDSCARLAAMRLSLIVCMMLLYLPNYWGNYQLILILPVLTLLANMYADCRREYWQGIVAAGCWFVMILSRDGNGMYVPFSLWQHSHEGIKTLSGYRPYAPLLLWFAVAWAMHRSVQRR